MAQHAQDDTVTEPFPISAVGNRYFLYDVNVITYVRREHRICGVLIGALPQIPQQNVFLGIPVRLMPEEVRLLVEAGAAYIVDDVKLHENGIGYLNSDEQLALRRDLDREGRQAFDDAKVAEKQKQEAALRKLKAKGKLNENAIRNLEGKGISGERGSKVEGGKDQDEDLFAGDAETVKSDLTKAKDSQRWTVTPTTSRLPAVLEPFKLQLPKNEKPSSYALFSHLHSKGYYLSPGLRFGCQYLVYPGDPLRFHSHFLAVSAEWEEEIDLLDIIGGGRLGTGVKKGFMIGGIARPDDDGAQEQAESENNSVRTFCIEWGGM